MVLFDLFVIMCAFVLCDQYRAIVKDLQCEDASEFNNGPFHKAMIVFGLDFLKSGKHCSTRKVGNVQRISAPPLAKLFAFLSRSQLLCVTKIRESYTSKSCPQ